MRFRLRTLLILMAVLPPLLAMLVMPMAEILRRRDQVRLQRIGPSGEVRQTAP
jgi:hypothetical protein